jgi:hypothetical protein
MTAQEIIKSQQSGEGKNGNVKEQGGFDEKAG